MSIVSETLYNGRIKQGLTVAEISKKTNIRQYYIKAIESGDYSKLPGDVYAKGFIRNYANALGLDANSLIEEYKKENSIISVDEDLKENLSTKERIERRRKDNFNFFMKKKILAGIAVLLVIALSFFFLADSSNEVDSGLANDKDSTKIQTNSKYDPVSSNNLLETTEENVEQLSSNQKSDNIEIKIIAKGNCWTEITVDGKNAFYGMMNKDQIKSWSGKNISIKLGNISAVDLFVDNKQYIPTANELKELVIKKEFNYKK